MELLLQGGSHVPVKGVASNPVQECGAADDSFQGVLTKIVSSDRKLGAGSWKLCLIPRRESQPSRIAHTVQSTVVATPHDLH